MITLTREEAQKILDALNVYASKAEHKRTHADNCEAEEAIETLRAALAQPEKNIQWVELSDKDSEELKAAIKKEGRKPVSSTQQPEPEPVAWIYEFGTDNCDAVNEIRWYKNVSLTKPTGLVRNVTPLYTASPQRKEWVGLLDEELAPLPSMIKGKTVYEFARAIEQALKEKNT